MVWILVAFLVLALVTTAFLLYRATSRLFQFDTIFQMIIDPMQEYAVVLRKLTSGEGLLHDHPEVMEFHKANINLLRQVDAAVKAIREERPEKKRKQLPRPEVG